MSNNNNGLYFLVGGLLVAVIVMGALYFTNTDSGQEVVRETNTVVEKTVDEATDEDRSGSSFELNVDEEGFSASSSNGENESESN
jgi:hypothetical protein